MKPKRNPNSIRDDFEYALIAALLGANIVFWGVVLLVTLTN